MQIHLPDRQQVFFTANGVIDDKAKQIEATGRTTLTKFFALNDLIKSTANV